MKCPVCGSSLNLEIEPDDKIRLWENDYDSVRMCFLDYFINRNQRTLDPNYYQVTHLGGNQYKYKVYIGNSEDEICYLEGTAEVRYDISLTPEFQLQILTEREVTEQIDE